MWRQNKDIFGHAKTQKVNAPTPFLMNLSQKTKSIFITDGTKKIYTFLIFKKCII